MMNRVSAIIILLFLFTTSLPAKTKTQVKGFATSGFVPVVNMLVSAVDTTGTVVATTRSDEQGNFTLRLPNGQYTLTFQCTGYRNTKREISVQGKDIEMHIMMRLGEELRAASITAKSLLKKQPDRFVYDVSRDIQKNDISMTDMMMKIPELLRSTKDGKLEYQGEEITRIIIDNEDSGFISAKRQYPMEFIKASYMKTIELILPNSPEYNNSSPILHIKLSRPLPYGVAGMTTAHANTDNSVSSMVDAVTNMPYIGLGFTYTPSYSFGREISERTVNEYLNGATWESETSSRNRSFGHNMNMNVYRKFFDENVTLNASVGTSFSKNTSQSGSTTNGVQMSSSHGESVSPYHINLGLSLNGSFGPSVGKKNKKYRWKVAYTLTNNTFEGLNEHKTGNEVTLLQTSMNGQKNHKLVGSLTSFSHQKLNLNGQIKAGWYGREYMSSTNYPHNQGMEYMQNVAFTQINVFCSPVKNLFTSFFLTGEYVSDKGNFQQKNDYSPLDYKEFNIIPNISIGYSKDKGSLKISYSQNVRRPGVNQLNPYVDVTNPLNIKTGNPHLVGSLTNIYQINYSYVRLRSFSVNAGGQYSSSSNEIQSLTMFSNDGIATQTYANVGKTNRLSADITASYSMNKSLVFRLSSSYGLHRAFLPNGTLNTYSQPSFSLQTRWYNKLFDLDADVSLNPSISSVQSGKLIMEPRISLSAGRYFEKPKIGVKIFTADLLHTYGSRSESEIRYDQYTQHVYRSRPGRVVNFSVFWFFGKFKQTNEPIVIDSYDK